MSEQKYWVGFSLVPEIGPRRLEQLQQHFGQLANAWRASEAELRQAGLDSVPTGNLIRLRKRLDLDAYLDRLDRLGIRAITRIDSDYPDLLKPLPDAPPVLFVKGTLLPEDARALAIVGTRKATVYGRDVTASFARQLVAQGFTVVSGLAHGIDAVAHQTALDSGGRTIAVLGTGIDVIYPADHRALAGRIVESGALVSEFPLGTRPDRRNFPRRNRLISGMSLGVLIAEAPEKSGALITANIAADQGREVFAVPGSIFSPASAGTNRLIQEGAKLVSSVSDVLEELQIAYQAVETRVTTERIAPADGNEALIIQCIGVDPVHIDDVVRRSGLPAATVSGALTLLELKGLVRNVGPMMYALPRQS
ncbi:MAG: DNA-processing protein DprA [Chloroflexota bacterium]|nr:MAG: DNA-protecting protein DprA [Chloroflexota bacterium]